MKRLTIIALSWIGALALICGAVALLINSQAPSYDKRAKEEFGSAAAIHAIEKLYSRIADAPNNPELKTLTAVYRLPGYAKVLRVPKAWMPKEFSQWGSVLDSELIEPTEVVAYYDTNNTLLAIEFLGTRYGCFISRDANRCPPRFDTLNRLAENPLFITARIGLSPTP
jgi:hypothetical protein